MAAPKQEKEPKINQFSFSDVLGLGKIIEKIPLQKINALMAFCLTFDIVLFLVYGYLFIHKKNQNGFPTDWDMRFMVVVTIIIAAVCIGNYIKNNSKKQN